MNSGCINSDLSDFEKEKIKEFRKRLNEIINTEEKLDEGLIREQIIRYLRQKKYDVGAALANLKKGVSLELGNSMGKVPYEEYKRVYEDQIFVFLKERAPDGSKIIWARSRNWDINKVDAITYMAGFYHYLDEALYSDKSLRHGFTFIIDTSGVAITTAAKMISFFNIDVSAQVLSYFQGAFPMKLKAIHYINAPLIFVTFYAGIKFLMSKKIRSRIHLHSKGPEALFKHFDKNFLPESLNGPIPDEEAADLKLLKAVNETGINSGPNFVTFRKYFTSPN